MRLRARTLSGIPGGFLYAPRKMLRAEARGHNSQLALLRQVSPGLQRIFLGAKRKPAPSTQAVRARSLTGAVCWRE